MPTTATIVNAATSPAVDHRASGTARRPDPADQQHRRRHGDEVTGDHRKCRQAAVEVVRHQQDWCAEKRREDAEVGVCVPVADETLVGQAPFRHRQAAVEHRPRLQVEEVRVRALSQQVGATERQVPVKTTVPAATMGTDHLSKRRSGTGSRSGSSSMAAGRLPAGGDPSEPADGLPGSRRAPQRAGRSVRNVYFATFLRKRGRTSMGRNPRTRGCHGPRSAARQRDEGRSGRCPSTVIPGARRRHR